jgi:hypothetical protein
MDTKTSPVSPKCQRGSSFVFGNMFVLVNPLTATPFFFPARAALDAGRPRGFHAARSECRQAQNLPQGKPVMRRCTLVPPPPLVSTDLSAMASHLVIDPSDVARRVVESNLRVVWRGSQRVNLSVCMYVCDCKMWWNCGWRWDNKAIPF